MSGLTDNKSQKTPLKASPWRQLRRRGRTERPTRSSRTGGTTMGRIGFAICQTLFLPGRTSMWVALTRKSEALPATHRTAPRRAATQRNAFDGEFPNNTSGGQLSCGQADAADGVPLGVNAGSSGQCCATSAPLNPLGAARTIRRRWRQSGGTGCNRAGM